MADEADRPLTYQRPKFQITIHHRHYTSSGVYDEYSSAKVYFESAADADRCLVGILGCREFIQAVTCFSNLGLEPRLYEGTPFIPDFRVSGQTCMSIHFGDSDIRDEIFYGQGMNRSRIALADLRLIAETFFQTMELRQNLC